MSSSCLEPLCNPLVSCLRLYYGKPSSGLFYQHMSSIFPTLVECSVYHGYCSRRLLDDSEAGRSERMHPEGSLEQGTSTNSRHRSCQNDLLVHPRRFRISVTHHYPRFFNQHADSSAGVFPVDERHHMSSDDFNHAGFLQWLATDIILLPNPEPTEFSVVAPVDAVATVNDISPRHPVLAARTSGSSGPASHVGCTPKPSIPRTCENAGERAQPSQEIRSGGAA